MIECISYSTHMQMIKSKCVKRLIQQHIITLIRPIVNARLQIKTKSDLQQIGGFLQVLRFPPSIKLTATI
jgi:hypothetical protein